MLGPPCWRISPKTYVHGEVVERLLLVRHGPEVVLLQQLGDEALGHGRRLGGEDGLDHPREEVAVRRCRHGNGGGVVDDAHTHAITRFLKSWQNYHNIPGLGLLLAITWQASEFQVLSLYWQKSFYTLTKK